ncbi:hypothetical protein F4779DRAFT_630576 [Xylariaceae sp. FL0662B]|nr:hypothetical protein F4779DRAFT_630576 [Xylariaceae sp. FL0662B]
MASLPPNVDLCTIPAGEPPNGKVSNLIDPDTLAPATISICTILTVWAVLFAIVKLYLNWRKLSVADYFTAIAAVLTITYTGLIMSDKYNRHQWDISACWLDARYLRIIYAHTTIVGAVLFFPKCAIFLMYRQVFEVNELMRAAIWTGLVFNFAIYFPSIPLSAIYEAPKPGHTWDELLMSLASSQDHTLIYWGIVQGSCSVALDLYIFLLPLPSLSRLQLPIRKKLQLIALFATTFGVVASVIALVFRVELLHNEDSTWQQARLAICVVVENSMAIVVGSMPAFANFVRLHVAELWPIRSLRSKFHSSRTGYSYGSSAAGAAPLPNGTFGSPPRKPPHHYYELTDTTLMQTQVTAPDEEIHHTADAENQRQAGIMRTVDISRQSRFENLSASVQ